jgi:hypothetical protein
MAVLRMARRDYLLLHIELERVRDFMLREYLRISHLSVFIFFNFYHIQIPCFFLSHLQRVQSS